MIVLEVLKEELSMRAELVLQVQTRHCVMMWNRTRFPKAFVKPDHWRLSLAFQKGFVFLWTYEIDTVDIYTVNTKLNQHLD